MELLNYIQVLEFYEHYMYSISYVLAGNCQLTSIVIVINGSSAYRYDNATYVPLFPYGAKVLSSGEERYISHDFQSAENEHIGMKLNDIYQIINYRG